MGGEIKLEGPDLAVGIDAAKLADDRPLLGHAAGEPVILVRTKGQIFAVGAVCTHYSGPLADGIVTDGRIHCPWHHACFDLATGAVARAPAFNPIPCFRVERDGALVRVGAKVAPAPAPAPASAPAANAPSAIVIVGTGAAGHAAAEALRTAGYRGRLTLVGRDVDPPYDRPNLSKDYLAGTAPEEWMLLRPREHYASLDVALETGRTVTALDVGARRVTLDDGRQLDYDRLLLATGADPIELAAPGADRPNVHMLRTFEDCRRIIAALGSVKRAVLIGGGFIGLEAAASLRARGIEVAVVTLDRVPLAPLGPEVGTFLRGLHEQHGVQFQLGQTVSAVEADAVVTSSGVRLPADLVLVGIGVRPSTALAERAGLKIDRGIVVDQRLETSAPGVFAAGDAARFPDARSGEAIRVEHWAVAQQMGRVAAENMLGARRRFTEAPFFWTVHYDVTVAFTGHAAGYDQIAIDGNIEARDFRAAYRRGGKTIAVLTVGRDRQSLEAEHALEVV